MKMLFYFTCIIISSLTLTNCMFLDNSRVAKCLQVQPNENNCNFYQECLAEDFKCDKETGYPLGFANYYCRAYEAAILKSEDPLLTDWVDKVKICLKRQLVPFYQTALNSGVYNCEDLKKFAFNSHPECYMSSGMCPLIKNHKFKFLVLMKDVFMNFKSFKSIFSDFKLWFDQIYEVMKGCYGTIPNQEDDYSEYFNDYATMETFLEKLK